MQTQLYGELKKILSSEKIVYVFGSGISSALADTSLNWEKWLNEGINYILDKDLAGELNELIENNPTTDDLIYIAGEVITETKKNNTYDTWMKNTVENLKIMNEALAETLSLIRIIGDIITTTNYDQLLEIAIGLDSITYGEPDKAFHMIDKGKANFVLHLHGLYDSKNNIDNIIASKEQYDSIYNDEAAQFVQQLLGTRTLVFIGAGQTTEDANISRFIKFAGEKLKIDRPYVYIKKSDYIVPKLPENFIIIDYGDNYDDLPEFLYQMITYRVSEFLSRNPIIGRTTFDTGNSDGYGLGGYHFAKESIPFSGRVGELSKLKIFAEIDKQILWWAITGQGGSGKSRLAYEFIKKIDKEYYSFFLRPTVTDEDLKSFIPFTDTFIVIDYIKGNEGQISKIIKKLIGKYKQSPYKLRLLMLERGNDTGTGSWYQNLLDNMNVYDRVEFEKYEYLVDTIFRKHNFLYLVDLEESAVEELIGNVCFQKGLPKDKGRDAKLREDYAKKFEQLRYRPLFLQIYVESWIDNGGRQVSYDSFESLLEASIQKEQERWLKATNNNTEATEALLSIIIRASIADGMKIGDIPDIYKDNWDLVKANFSMGTLPGIQRKRKINISIADTMGSLKITGDFINPQYPDIIKEYMFLYYTDEEEMGKTCTELWENAAPQFGTFLGRCVMDFPDNIMLISTIKKATEDTNNSHALKARLSLSQQETVRSIEGGAKILKTLAEEYEFWKNIKWDDYLSKESKEVILRGLYLCSVGFRGWQLLKESVEAVYDLISHAEDISISEHCYNLIVNRMTALTDEGGYTYSEKIFNKIKIVDKKLDRWKKLIKLKILRNHTVNLYGMNEKDEAEKLSEKIADYAEWKDVDQLEVYANTLYSLAKLEYANLQSGDLLSYGFELEDMMVYVFENSPEYQVNDLIHYYYLHSKYLKVDRLSLVCGLSPENNMRQYALGLIDSLIEEIERNEMINEFSGLYVGAWGLKVAYDIKVTDKEAENYIEKAFDYCNEYVDNAFLCEKTIMLVSATYLEQYKRKPPISIVDRCYSLLLRFPTSNDLITEFFGLVKQAEIPISQWHEKYVKKKNIVAGLFSNRRTDILYPEEVKSGPNTTYVRTHPKIGANEPCPCGSGKKFKKCCRGKGRYD